MEDDHHADVAAHPSAVAMLALLRRVEHESDRLVIAGVSDELILAYNMFIRPTMISIMNAADRLHHHAIGRGADVGDLVETHGDACRSMMRALADVMEVVSRLDPEHLRRPPRRSARIAQLAQHAPM